jgi:hypothetical protein
MEIENIINIVNEAKNTVAEKIADWKAEFLDDEKQNIIQEFKENGKDRIKQILSDLDDSTGIIEDIGYQFSAFTIDLGIPPSITLSFEVIPIKPEKAQAKIPEDINPILKIILHALERTNTFNQSIVSNNFSFKQVNIILGILPDISIQYKRV